MKIKNLRWIIVSLVGLATVINYIDRSALPVMWPSISKDLGLDKSDYANIITIFMIGYAIGQSLFGRIMDAIGTRIGFVLAITTWSVAIALHSVANSMLSFSLFRALLGIGEAGNWPGATKANAEWFPVKERALAQGIFNAGASLGAIIAPPLIAFIYVLIGWKATFFVISCIGLLWIIPWLSIYKSGPNSHPWLTAEERKYILSGQVFRKSSDDTKNEYTPGIWQLLRHKQTWSVIFARFFIDPIWWMFVAWLPLYLNEKFNFDIKEIGAFAWFPYIGAAAGALFGGWFSGHLISRGCSINKARKLTIFIGCALMLPALLLTTIANMPMSAVILIAVILFGFQTAIGNIQTLPSDFFNGKSVGGLSGVSGTAAVLSVIIATQFVPYLTEGGNYAPFFILGAALVPLTLMSVFLSGEITPVKTNNGKY
ncbi:MULTISPECIES: MFS transporter [Enterobacteriaceae]|uniref:MFS transporter n=1 Tax=Enterobacteriaceae TaxID=543 RepID=UPI0004D371F1|nr:MULTISPECIES: MFS transporter [Enterobacteriaceae]KDY80346.1 sugar (and other) transporter family protein [Escherichia coli 2-474-04_S1_C1]MBL0783101.1 MFS transporter [Klebsiella michiganensis]PUV36144.1 MFS transporter [Cronobacter sakazakii]